MHIEKILNDILNTAAKKGVQYIEVTWGYYHKQFLEARDQVLTAMTDEENEGISVRVHQNGAWGFSAAPLSKELNPNSLIENAKAVALAGSKLCCSSNLLAPIKPHSATWSSPVSVDPFSVPVKEKADLLFSINQKMASVSGIQETRSYMRFNTIEKHYMNSIGSNIRQTTTRSDTDYTASAVGNGRFETRDFQSLQQAIGYEGVEADRMINSATRVAEEAVQQLTAKPFDADKADLILLPNHTRLVIHETIGHATELDRVLGWEADFAGTSFATPEKLGNYQYGSKLFNVTADRTQKHGLASCLYDDEGVPCQTWPMIKDGILVDYATTRDTAPLIGSSESHGCAFADNWYSFPILRMANVGIDAGPESAPSLKQLIEDTENGILVDGMAAYSIDHQRMNFQFSGDYCRKISNGKIQEPLWNIVYNGRNPEFWNSMDAVCNKKEWQPYGIYGCAKGQPVQITALTHGSAPLRLRNVDIIRSK